MAKVECWDAGEMSHRLEHALHYQATRMTGDFLEKNVDCHWLLRNQPFSDQVGPAMQTNPLQQLAFDYFRNIVGASRNGADRDFGCFGFNLNPILSR